MVHDLSFREGISTAEATNKIIAGISEEPPVNTYPLDWKVKSPMQIEREKRMKTKKKRRKKKRKR